MEKARADYKKIGPVLRNHHLHHLTKIRFIKFYAIPLLLCGMESWTLQKYLSTYRVTEKCVTLWFFLMLHLLYFHSIEFLLMNFCHKYRIVWIYAKWFGIYGEIYMVASLIGQRRGYFVN